MEFLKFAKCKIKFFCCEIPKISYALISRLGLADYSAKMEIQNWQSELKTQSYCWPAQFSEDSYAHAEALNASLLRAVHRFPDPMVRRLLDKQGFDQSEHSLGHLIHQFWLEPDLAQRHWAVLPKAWECPTPEFRKKKAGFESEHKAQGRGVVTHTLWESVQKGLEALDRNSEATQLRAQSKTEVTAFWRDPDFGVFAKARFDLLGQDHFWDLKCHRGSMQSEKLKKSLGQMGFFIQMWWYQRSLLLSGYAPKRCGHIALDTEIWEVRVRDMSASELALGQYQAQQAWARLKFLLKGRWSCIEAAASTSS